MSRSHTTATDLARLLDDGAAPLYVLDEDRRIIYCNAACALWVGLAADELVGHQCNYHAPGAEPGPSGVAVGLCPPPAVFSGHAQMAVVSCARPDGRLVDRRGFFLPLADGQDESAPVIAILETSDCPPDAHPDERPDDARLHEQVRRFRHQTAGRFAAESLIGNNPLVARARLQIELAAGSGASVLIVGPRGSGKDHAAKAIHYCQSEPGLLVPLDCAVLETNVLRSALRTLCARSATRPPGGTVVLEDVDSMPGDAQQDMAEILRAGTLNMRVIATSAAPLSVLAAEGRFLHELVCALSTLVIELPPLAQRLDDLPLLAQAILEEINATSYRQLSGFTPQALDQLAAYSWPGNIDELAAAVRETHEKAQGCEVTAHDLPKRIHWAAADAGHPSRADDSIVLVDFLGRVEKELIARAMRRAKGNKSKAAKLLGLTRPRLYRRLVQLGLEQPDQRGAEPKN
ncbi:MAG: helix-turn-helix domain-containing protein [Pirellulales bacterium]